MKKLVLVVALIIVALVAWGMLKGQKPSTLNPTK